MNSWLLSQLTLTLSWQEGASKEDIELLPKFTFCRDGAAGKTSDEIQGLCG
ncbi:hypothetical protein Hanom_Chr09g00842011 [Helianthus anomalus]